MLPSARGGVTRLFRAHLRFRLRKRLETREKKNESAVMAVNQEPDSEVTAETKLDKIDGGGGMTCFMSVEIEKDIPPVGELPPETMAETWVADSGCSQFMTPSANYMINYREGGGVFKITDGRAMPIEGNGNLSMSVWSGQNWVQVVLPNATHVPLPGYNLLSLKRMAVRGHKYVGEKKGLTFHLKIGKTLFGRKAESSFRIPTPSRLEYFCACNDCAGKDPVRVACGYQYVSCRYFEHAHFMPTLDVGKRGVY